MQALMRRWGIQNTDLRYYRDKYVTLLFIVAMLAAIAVLADRHLNHAELVQGVKLLVLAVICIAFLPYRLAAVAALLAIAAFRLFLAAIFTGWWPAIIMALVAGAAALTLVLGRLAFKGDYSLPYKIQPYSTAEAVIDLLAFLVMVGIIRGLIA